MNNSWNQRICVDLSPTEANSIIDSKASVIDLASPGQFGTGNPKGPWRFDRLVGIGAKDSILYTDKESIGQLRNWLDRANDLVMGWFCYDLKNLLEPLSSANQPEPKFPLFRFVVPDKVLISAQGRWKLYSHCESATPSKTLVDSRLSLGHLHLSDREHYFEQVNSILQHIRMGDIYEANYCIRNHFDNATINPAGLFDRMLHESASPFSCRIAFGDLHLLSASPERFITKMGKRVFSQPMKGTSRRANDNPSAMEALASDAKERAENIMITDLVRNDLSRNATKGSVSVDGLCEVYPFAHVNQMISTVSCELKEGSHPLDMILGAFPMGSMTGAPKVRAMEIIDAHEDFARGLFSGSVGYFTPNLDFDFNVVIRSILFDEHEKKLSFPTGSAITAASDPEQEYQECLLKAEATIQMLKNHVGES